MVYRLRLLRRDLPGRSDVVFFGRCCIVEVRGCFWHHHGCSNAATPKTQSDWWAAKLAASVARNRRNLSTLRRLGWRVLVVWGVRGGAARLGTTATPVPGANRCKVTHQETGPWGHDANPPLVVQLWECPNAPSPHS